jgi:CysZ protein
VALQFTAVMVLLNLLVLPLYLVPVVNVVAFYGINGYLLSREYFDLVALRRLDARAAQRLRQAQRGRLFVAGLLIAGLLTIPLVNLLAPLIAAAFMVHVVDILADLTPRSGPVLRQP